MTFPVLLFLNHEVGAEEIVKQADMAMYQAQEAGGNSLRYVRQRTDGACLYSYSDRRFRHGARVAVSR